MPEVDATRMDVTAETAEVDAAPSSLPQPISFQQITSADGRVVIPDITSWNKDLFFTTNNHASCDNVGEVY